MGRLQETATHRLAALAFSLPRLLSSAPTPAESKLPGGFRGLKWRSPVAPGMKLKKEESVGDKADYTRPTDVKKLHGTVLESITCGYVCKPLVEEANKAEAERREKATAR